MGCHVLLGALGEIKARGASSSREIVTTSTERKLMTSLSNMLCAFGPASRPNIRIFGNSLKKFQHTSCGKHFWDQLEWTQIVKTATATDDRDVDNKSWKCWSADDWELCKARWRRFSLCFGGNNTKRWQKNTKNCSEHLGSRFCLLRAKMLRIYQLSPYKV